MITEIINHNNHTNPHKGEIIMIKMRVGGTITTLSISTIIIQDGTILRKRLLSG